MASNYAHNMHNNSNANSIGQTQQRMNELEHSGSVCVHVCRLANLFIIYVCG